MTIDRFTNREDLKLALVVDKMDIFNYALYENGVAPIRGLHIINDTGDPMNGLFIRITSDSSFFEKFEAYLPTIPSGKPVDLQDPKLVISGRELAGLTEAVNVTVLVELCQGEETICGAKGQMRIFAYDEWQGSETYRDLLPAFVLPNHPVIPVLMHDAAEVLGRWGKPTSLEGYQSEDPNRVRDLAAAAYAAVQKKNIVYAEPPASFSSAGQRIRTPETIMDQHLGTCMDMTLLYAALLEAMGLHPLLVMLKGHIFAGVWLKERSAKELKSCDVVIDNLDQLTMRIDNGSDEMTFIECTAMCAGKNVSFEDAERSAKYKNLNPEEFRFAIDVFLSRIYGVKPIASRISDGGVYKIDVEEKSADELTDAPTDLGISIQNVETAGPRKITNKRELWESKLLDLSPHNMLLNLQLTAAIEPVMSSHIDELEDALSDGHEFNLLPAPDWIMGLAYREIDKKGKEGKEKHWLTEMLKKYGVFELNQWPVSSEFDFNEKFRQEYRNHRLYTFSTQSQLDRELTSIYRASRASQQENGVSSLYLAVGLLRWFPAADSDSPCYAPLILLPIEIVRKSANQGYALHSRDEDPHFNTTLLEMLKQYYNIEIGGLDPLPTDEHGIHIKKVFSIVRSALYTVKNWDVVETCVIGNFSFAKFAMWNDIHTAGDVLEGSKMVRSLMKGHVDWNVTENADCEDDTVYLPITVDDTQLKAIKMAAHGTTFVLHGPPGTGKSQTVTGMIANLMAKGKRVLFVAEKMAALSVVQKRLSGLGIGNFCLELHSDKANKKQVLTQLEKALSVAHPSEKTEYEEYLKRTTESRAKLDGYATHLHMKRSCGMSLRELIAAYEIVRDGDKYIRFDRTEAGKLTEDELKTHIFLIGRLTATGEAVGGISNSPLIGVGVTSYGAELRSSLGGVSWEYTEALKAAGKTGSEAARLLDMPAPKTKSDLEAMDRLAEIFFAVRSADSTLLAILREDSARAYDYFDRQESIEAEKAKLLIDWREEFLGMDMAALLAKHEAAGKKIFGKSSAMAAVTAEIQTYAGRNVPYEQIPSMLRLVTEYQKHRSELAGFYDDLPEGVRALIKQYPDRAAYEGAYKTAEEYVAQASRFPGGMDAVMNADAETTGLLEKLRADVKRLAGAEDAFDRLLERREISADKRTFEAETALCEYVERNPAALKDWGLYNQARQECVKVGLLPVVEAYESGFAADELVGAYRKGLYYALINYIVSTDDILSSFSGATFNESIEQFKRLDERMLELTRKEIYYQLASRVPQSWDSAVLGMELNLLRKAIGSGARGMSIRTLFEKIPNILPFLCPCMLMSPNSVAQYMAQDNDLFDVVIFDEASQLPTCKAIGALMRARDAVIVGDPKQMPPTSFFDGSGPVVDDLALDDLDSILDDALALGIPSQHLQWHYRSTHESLIAFSNNQFYENKMYTFPSANDRERHVTAVHVDGVYSKSTNVKEAEAVVAEVIRRFNDPALKGQSIGIVTFNTKQQELIENLLTKQFQTNPEMDAWASSGEDPLFVKNLENVQGDERDVILFSIGYGPDENGRVSNNFGPINKAGGGKRLNVAFSRARVTMTIFSSMYSSDIKVTETSPEGVIAFRDFLRFAEGHDIQSDHETDTKAALGRAGILQRICREIEEHGYQCAAMVGHSDFHVDIAVVDPYEPEKYMMGILLDGDGYRQTKNTRDREVAQTGVLKRLGWTLCRVWTVDWWDNRDKEIRKLISKLDQLKEESESRHAQALATAQTGDEEAARNQDKTRKEQEARIRAELEAQAAEVVAENEEASWDVRTVDDPFASGGEKADDEVETETESHETVEPEAPETESENIETVDTEMPETEAVEADAAESESTETVTPETGVSEVDTAVAKMEKAESEPTEYVLAEVSARPMNAAEFAASSSKSEIVRVITQIVAVESPILKDTLMRKTFAAFGVNKTSGALEAFEKALKVADTKNAKLKGVVFCWRRDQNPSTYMGIRVSNDRSGEEIAPQEIRNAIRYVLKNKGSLEKDDLIKETSLVFGYKRLGKNLEAALLAGLQWTRSSGAITALKGNRFELPAEETAESTTETAEATETTEEAEDVADVQ